MSPPSVSVVIASGAGGEFLFRCLASLRTQALEHGVPVLVVDRCGEATRARIGREDPHVQVVAPKADHPLTVPELRRIGVEAAATDVVAVLEEHCTAPPHWLATIRREFRTGDAAIGGPILDASYRRVRDWVVYFSEYHGYAPPWPAGERFTLSGANIAYARAKVLAHREVLDSGYWEVVLHPRLARDGVFRSVPDMGAYHTGPFDYAYYLRQRYLLSRVWGGTERRRVSRLVRAAHVLGAPLMPVLMLSRMARLARREPRLVPPFVRALPLLIVAMATLAWGEAVGYLLGPGRALEEVE